MSYAEIGLSLEIMHLFLNYLLIFLFSLSCKVNIYKSIPKILFHYIDYKKLIKLVKYKL